MTTNSYLIRAWEMSELGKYTYSKSYIRTSGYTVEQALKRARRGKDGATAYYELIKSYKK